MAKKKKLKFSKKQKKTANLILVPGLAALLGLLLGIAAIAVFTRTNNPSNVVWGADSSVVVPTDLRKFLEDRRECNEYRGKGTPSGVGLWGVYQISQERYAKIAYGCSWNLESYIMAVKKNNTWQLLQPSEYFAPFKDGVDPKKGALPFCAVIDHYKIPKNIESFCITADGSARANENK